MTEYDAGRHALESLRDWYADKDGSRNEATTRLHLIDRILFDCLGWSREEDTVLEEAHGSEYADYVLRCPHRMLIVEAKKEGDYFELPVGKQNLEYSLPSLCRDFPNVKSALQQVASYAQTRGTPFAAISNGHQIIAFVATRSDGTPPLEGHGVVFPSLQYMVDHFHDLWQHLSRPATIQSRLLTRLVARLTPNLPTKLSATLPDYPGVRARNIFQTDLHILSDLVLEDIARSPELEEEFLTDTYCQSGALSQHALTSKRILKARYDAIFDDTLPGPTTVPAAESNAASHLLAESLSRRPIMLIGDVGVGKTTFIRRLLTIDAKEEFKNAIALYIDFGSGATLDADLARWVISEIRSQLKTTHSIDIQERNFVHGVYHGEILDFRNGIYGDLKDSNPALFREKEVAFLSEKINQKDEHLRASLAHISKAHKKQIVVFLDNADQRRDIEEQIFLIAQELANKSPATVFVAIRPETFHRSRTSGVLSGYHPKAFTIAPPRIERVIEKRLQFARKMTTGDIVIPALQSNMELPRLDRILKSFQVSLERNSDLVECIDNMASGNVRLALDYVKAFFGSGHVDTRKIADICESGDDYIVPVHEFVRAIIYNDCKHYSPNASCAVNLFDVGDADPKEHFLLLMMLCLLQKEGNLSANAGFVPSAKLIDKLQERGFSPMQVQRAAVRAFQGGLCETSGRVEATLDSSLPSSFRSTTKGLYHAMRLSRMFTYLDAITVDLPIFDEAVRKAIHDTFVINERVERATRIREYLSAVWKSFEGGCDFFDWTSIAEDLQNDIDQVKARLGNA